MNEKVILFQGDSITDCGRDREKATHRGRGYAQLVTAHLMCNEPYRYICHNRGISGNRVVDLYARIRRDENTGRYLLYKAADLAVVPISYDFDTIDVTGIFIKVIKRVKNIQLVFLPNRINSTENRADEMKQREETVKILGRIGRVTPRIKQSVVIKRYSTVSPLDKYQKAAVEHAFDAIVEQIKL